MKRERRQRGSGKCVGGPDIVEADLVYGTRLSEHEIFAAHFIEENIEGAGKNPIDACMEKVTGGGRVFFEEDTQRMRGIEALELREPESGKGGVRCRFDSGAIELVDQILGGVVGKASVDGNELLVQDRRSQETSHLLLFSGVARKGKGVANAGKNETGDAALEGLKERKFAVLKSDDQVTLAKFNSIRGRNGVDLFGVKTKAIEGRENIAGGGLRGRESRAT